MGVEKWLPVVGYEGHYEVSDKGRVRSLDRMITMKNGITRKTEGRILAPQNSNGQGRYRAVTISRDGIAKRVSIHRLVAEAFIPNPNGFKEINHKDEDKTNNHVENLEWCDRQYNNTYGTAKVRAAVTQGKPVLQLDGDGNVINGWPSMGLAAMFTGASQGGISACCRGEISSSGGYGWKLAPWAR